MLRAMSSLNRLPIFCVLLLGIAAVCDAQTFRGGISGHIADATGAVLPGASVTATNDATGVARTTVNGVRTRGNNFQIAGADNNDAFQNTAAVNQGGVSGIAGTLLPIEAIDQFSVQSGGQAEMGRNAGSTVNLVIKSGTNDFHGSTFYFNRHEALSANSPVALPGSPKREIRNNQYGFSLGGPIARSKTFFFSTIEVQKLTAGNAIPTTAP